MFEEDEHMVFAEVEFAAEISKVYEDLERILDEDSSMQTVLNLCKGFYLFGFSKGIDRTLGVLEEEVEKSKE